MISHGSQPNCRDVASAMFRRLRCLNRVIEIGEIRSCAFRKLVNFASMAGTSYEPLSRGEDIDDNHHNSPRKDRTLTDDVLAVRPPVYYNDGPFSPPSSADESQEHLLGKDNDQISSAERGRLDHTEDNHSRIRESSLALKVVNASVLGSVNLYYRHDPKRRYSVRFVALCLVSLLGLVVIIGAFAAFFSENSYRTRGSKHITMDHVFNGTFGVDKKSLNWVPEGASVRIDRTFSHMTSSTSWRRRVFDKRWWGYQID